MQAMPSTTPLSRTARWTSSVMSLTVRPPVVRRRVSCWNTFIVAAILRESIPDARVEAPDPQRILQVALRSEPAADGPKSSGDAEDRRGPVANGRAGQRQREASQRRPRQLVLTSQAVREDVRRRKSVRRRQEANRCGKRRRENHLGYGAGRRSDGDDLAAKLGGEVVLELPVRARQDVLRRSEEPGPEVHLVVVALLLRRREPFDESLISREGAMDERGVDPEHQLRVGGGVARTCREGP